MAKPPSSLLSSPGLYSQTVGDVMITAVNDGIFQASFDLIAGLSQQDCEALERAAFRVLPPRMTMNSFLLRLGQRLELIDTGCGVSTEDKEKLFLPYFSTKGRGTGVGLAIVNHILSDHGAHIRVDDNTPTGARFTIEIPAIVEVNEPVSV